MHSSRMPTARSPTVRVLIATTRRQYRGGGWGVGGWVCPQVNKFEQVSSDVHQKCGERGSCHVSPYIIGNGYMGTPPPCGLNDRQADTCENITFPQLRNEIGLRFWNFTKIVQAYMCCFTLCKVRYNQNTCSPVKARALITVRKRKCA